MSSNSSTKKKPGRPKKESNGNFDIKNNKISEIPINPDNVIEFVYYKPQILKKIVGLCKSMENSQLFISFTKTGFQFKVRCGKDSNRNIKNIVNFDCKYINHYYCEFDYEMCLNLDLLFSVLGRFDKETAEMTFYLSKTNYRSTFNIDVVTLSPKKTTKITLYIIQGNKEDKDFLSSNDIFDDKIDPMSIYSNYDIVFLLPLKDFKKEIIEDTKINQVSKSGNINIIKFEKIGDDQLTINHSNHEQVSLIDEYDNEIIQYTTINKDDILSIEVETYFIKLFCSISNTTTANEKILVSIKKDKFIKFKIQLDDLINVELYNDIYLG